LNEYVDLFIHILTNHGWLVNKKDKLISLKNYIYEQKSYINLQGIYLNEIAHLKSIP